MKLFKSLFSQDAVNGAITLSTFSCVQIIQAASQAEIGKTFFYTGKDFRLFKPFLKF